MQNHFTPWPAHSGVVRALRALRAISLVALGYALVPVQAQDVHASADPVQRGRYMIVTGQCNNCHTSGYSASQGSLPEARWLLGDTRGRAEPEGTVYATNLRWLVQSLSIEQWVLLSRNSRARAPMPWWNLRQTSDEDLRAMYIYIRSLGPAGDPTPAFKPAARATSPLAAAEVPRP